MTNKQIQKNDEGNKYANITSYIHRENIMKYSIFCTNCKTEMMSSSCRWSEWNNTEESSWQWRHERIKEMWMCLHMWPYKWFASV